MGMKDNLSAFLDGELEDEAVAAACQRLGRDPELNAEWQTWCLIGDVLRGEQGSGTDFADELGADFGADLSARVLAALADEPTLLAPAALQRKPARPALVARLLPIAASVMGVAAVGVVAATLFSHQNPQPAALMAGTPLTAPATLAQAARPPQAVNVRQEAAADEALSEYLIAHQGASGGAMPAGMQYVRTVSLASGGGR